MKNLFNSIEVSRPQKNFFDLTHDVKLSTRLGRLAPVCVVETIPGDKFDIAAELLAKLAPLVAPVMHRYDASIHYFFVPNRILWENWGKWLVQNPDDLTPPVFPYVTIDSVSTNQSLTDYLGVPPHTHADDLVISAMPLAAYQAVYNEYYRDQNMITEVDYKLVDGDNTINGDLFQLRIRAWEHDYFTSALPTAQSGADAVGIPLGQIVLDNGFTGHPHFAENNGTIATGDIIQTSPGGGVYEVDVSGIKTGYDPDGSLVVDNTSIVELRRAYRLQEWLERQMRAGKRLTEHIWAFFGVKSSDSRLQRPEYITGVKVPITISEVLNTTGGFESVDPTTPTTPVQGNQSGNGIAVASGNFGSYYCEEHGFIIGILSILPKTAYMQGLPKHFLKIRDQYQYFYPQFAHIGEQAIESQELYTNQPASDRLEVFGYIPRYAEYKYEPSRVCGDFRTTLDHWHHARKFSGVPILTESFVTCTPGDRVFAVDDGVTDNIYVHVLNKIRAVRGMPKFGSPTI